MELSLLYTTNTKKHTKTAFSRKLVVQYIVRKRSFIKDIYQIKAL